MSWLIYEKDTAKIVKTFHLKKKAKEYINSHFWAGPDREHFGLAYYTDPTKLEEWKVWKLLSMKHNGN